MIHDWGSNIERGVDFVVVVDGASETYYTISRDSVSVYTVSNNSIFYLNDEDTFHVYFS